MQKNFILTLLKLVGFGLLLAFVGMLYWSSLLVEEDLKQVKQEIEQLKERADQAPVVVQTEKSKAPNPHIDPSLPNLLEPDPFLCQNFGQLAAGNFVPSGTRHTATVGQPENSTQVVGVTCVFGKDYACWVFQGGNLAILKNTRRVPLFGWKSM